MLSVPMVSVSQALGNRFSLIMLITVQGTTPKYSSIEVQHCTELTVSSLAFIHPSITAPSFDIFSSAASGTLLVAVSYTHLRAHETGRKLVCRLLLEKK